MDNPASLEDLATRWRELTTAEEDIATSLLEDAWVVLTSRLPNLEDNLTAGTVSTAAARMVVCAMTLRALRNPDGYVSETIGNYSYQRATGVGSSGLWVSDEELALVSPSGVLPRGGFTIRQVAVPEVAPCPTPWWWP